MALKDRLVEDNVGATSQSTSPAYLSPPGNIFTNAPIYTDEMAAIAQWFLDDLEGHLPQAERGLSDRRQHPGPQHRHPGAEGRYLAMGYEFVGAQFVPMVPTAPPTTQLAWLKDNKVDLALGVMINPGTQPTIKEAVRLGMGPDQAYKITFGFGNPAHLQIFVPGMGETGNGVVVAGDFCARDADVPGIEFADDLLRPRTARTASSANVMYLDGIIEAMTQVEALRLAALAVGDASQTDQPGRAREGLLADQGHGHGRHLRVQVHLRQGQGRRASTRSASSRCRVARSSTSAPPRCSTSWPPRSRYFASDRRSIRPEEGAPKGAPSSFCPSLPLGQSPLAAPPRGL